MPRQRALVLALRKLAIPLGSCRIHESSPSLCTYEFFARECRSFTASYYLPAHPIGSQVGAFLNVDLGRQPFADGSFDLVVTLDVLEHLPEPMLALREIGRTLAPGGLHVFTVPRADYRETQARARFVAGQVEHLREPEYHRDPIARAGSLVITDWGRDLEQLVSEGTALECAAMSICEPLQGIPQPIEVFVMRRTG